MISKQEEATLIALAEIMRDIFIQQQRHSAPSADQEPGKPLTDRVQ
jgi:hypothetical protein